MKRYIVLFSLLVAATVHAADVINYAPAAPTPRSPLVLIYGKIISAKDGHFLVQCQRATCRLPVYREVAESQDRLVHITVSSEARSRIVALNNNPQWRERGRLLQELDSPPLATTERRSRKEFAEDPSLWSEGAQLTLLGHEDGTFSYLNIVRKELTVANISQIEAAPLYTVVTPIELRRESAAAIASPPPTSAPKKELEDLPRYNLDTTVADLKVGITSEKVLRILGNPSAINGTQWVYARGYIYVENGVVTAMQNRAGGVFAADWK